MLKNFKSLSDFILAFSTEEASASYLHKVFWPNGVICPHCKSSKFYSYKDNLKHRCYDCGINFNVKTNTIFHKTHLPLPLWFLAIYLLSVNKKGISSIQLSVKPPAIVPDS